MAVWASDDRRRCPPIVLLMAGLLTASGCGPATTTSADPSQPRPLVASPVPSQTLGPEDSELERVLAELTSADGPGAIAFVRTPRGAWQHAAGQALGHVPAASSDRFDIASTTKTFVATVVLQLVGEGTLKLDDNLASWLPGRIREGDRITIRQLLNHTSGIPQTYAPQGGTGDQPALVAEPGTRHLYSNMNYVLLGLIVEQATAEPLEVVVRDRILQPLGLRDTTYGGASLGTNKGDLPRWLGAASEQTGRVAGDGGISSSATDMATFLEALLGGRLLGRAELAEMLRTVDTSDDPLAYGAAAPAWAGLGIFRFDLDCGSAWGHGGDMPGYSNQVLASADGSRIVIVAQAASGWPAANAAALGLFCFGAPRAAGESRAPAE
jgi:D-alanyl-D-alanine carboxypeptidase